MEDEEGVAAGCVRFLEEFYGVGGLGRQVGVISPARELRWRGF